MPEEINNEKKSNKKYLSKFIGMGIIILLGSALIIISVFAIGLYGFNWRNSATERIVKIIPYPISLVNYKFLRYSSFNDDVTTLKYYYEKLSAGPSNYQVPSEDDLEIIAIRKMIRDEFTRQLAKKYDITVSKTEVNQELDKIVRQSGSLETAEEIIKDLYNWTAEEFKNRVLYDYLIRVKMQEKLAYDDGLEYNKDAKNRAEEVLNKVKNEEGGFEDLAKEYSEDTKAADGGYLGFFRPGEMVSEFEAAVLELKEGEVSELVRTVYGFHIIKLVSTKGEGNNLQFEARHILLKTQDLDAYINDQLKNARVYVFAKDLKWDKETGEAVFPGIESTDSGL